jgi:hypothetical protein
MTRIWRNALLAASLTISALAIAAPAPVAATGPLAYVFNTDLASNKGLAFCEPATTKGCIDSVIIDGQQLGVTTNRTAANYIIAGGLYTPQCRFVETEAVPCELPYMVIYPSLNGIPTQTAVNEVTVNFRRAQNDLSTTRIGTTVVNGHLVSFTPAKPGLRDIATVVATPATIQRASSPTSPWCSGWIPVVDSCSLPETAQSKNTNSVNILLLPGSRSSLVPPDKLDSTCVSTIVNTCTIPVFEETSFGAWMDTDAYIFGMAAADRDTGATMLKIVGPHFKYPENGVSNELNLAYVRNFMPAPFLMASFGITPEEANAQTLPVTRTTGFATTIPGTVYTPGIDGLTLNTTGIGFSAPTVSIKRVLVVKKNKRLTAEQMVRAAGVFTARQFGAPKISVNSKAGMKKVGSRYVFTKARSLMVTVRYKSTPNDISYRTLSVRVTK